MAKRLEQANQAANPKEHLEEEHVKADETLKYRLRRHCRRRADLTVRPCFVACGFLTDIKQEKEKSM